MRVEAGGAFSSVEEIENLTVFSKNGDYFRLGDIALVCQSYVHPARNKMKTGNVPSIGIAISTVSDGNVVDMSELVEECMTQFEKTMPEGYDLKKVYDQGHESAVANDGFVLNLIISVITVVAVLLFFIGLKNGVLIGRGLFFSIFGTLIYMYASGIALQQVVSATITPPQTGATMDLTTGIITPATEYGTVPASMGINGLTLQYTMLPLQTTSPMTLDMSLNLNYDPTPHQYSVQVPIPDGGLQAGNSYLFRAIIDADTVTFPSVEVTDWVTVDETGNPLYPH